MVENERLAEWLKVMAGIEQPPADWQLVAGGVTAARGFLAAGVEAAIKYKGRLDVALLYSLKPCTAAAVFTTNRVKAAPLLLNIERIKSGRARAVVVNSGNANACTGPKGLEDAAATARAAAEALGIDENEVLVASTGVIGVPLPLERLLDGVKRAAAILSPTGGQLAAQAIMTTDTVPKEVALKFNLKGREITVGGMAKGAGMIHPQMATMLAFITSDAPVAVEALRAALQAAVEVSFNQISVDGDTSTNDMVLVLCNGEAGGPEIDPGTPEYELFRAALTVVCVSLARQVAADGEGATRLIEVQVQGAPDAVTARRIARSVVSSNLFKCAVYGQDANWGRILCAAGYAGVDFDPRRVDVYLGDVLVCRDGSAVEFDENRATAALAAKEVVVTIDLKQGSAQGRAWGCDMSEDYVRINGSYRT